MDNTNKKEAARRKTIGEIGELLGIKALVDNDFDKIKNLNDNTVNEAYADLYCEKDGKKFIVSVKTRNKYTKSGNLNTHYNLGTDAYRKAAYVAEKYNAEPYWMAIQLDENEYNVYFGSLSELEGKEQIPLKKLDNRKQVKFKKFCTS
jgi:hypothetical protein